MDLLYKHEKQKVFLAKGFRIIPGILTYSHADWWQVKGADHVIFFLSSNVTSFRVVADIPRIVVSDASYAWNFKKGGQ